MRRRHSVREILRILVQIEQSGVSIGAACEAHRITRMTYYRWKKRHKDALLAATLRMKKLEKENGLLDRYVGKNGSNRRDESGEPPAIDPLYESARMTVLLEENARLKRLVIEQALNIQRIKETSKGRRH